MEQLTEYLFCMVQIKYDELKKDCKLKKSLILKQQSTKIQIVIEVLTLKDYFNQKIQKVMLSVDLKQCRIDPNLYINWRVYP